jgi:isoleucyl-tRNA synthetase
MTGLKFNLPLLSPVDDRGDFTDEAGEALKGMNVLGDGNAKVIELLRSNDGLILQESYGHKYPYDWRTKKPTIFRATSQWFASVEGFRDDALAASGRHRVYSLLPALSACARWSPAETTGASRGNGRGACPFRAFTI